MSKRAHPRGPSLTVTPARRDEYRIKCDSKLCMGQSEATLTDDDRFRCVWCGNVVDEGTLIAESGYIDQEVTA